MDSMFYSVWTEIRESVYKLTMKVVTNAILEGQFPIDFFWTGSVFATTGVHPLMAIKKKAG